MTSEEIQKLLETTLESFNKLGLRAVMAIITDDDGTECNVASGSICCCAAHLEAMVATIDLRSEGWAKNMSRVHATA